MGFEPRIIAYLCTWCSYTGADTAGIARIKHPQNLRAVRVPCSGRVSPELIMRTFDQGADGVLVLGCHIGECHYDNGNHRTAKRLPVLQALMSYAGLEPQRLRLDWVSASEGERFSRIVTEFTEAVRALGPAPWRQPDQGAWGHDDPAMQVFPPPGVVQDLPGAEEACQERLQAITGGVRQVARQLLESGQVGCVIGYETGPRRRVRPVFIRKADQAERLVWNQHCTHNLSVYLGDALVAQRGKPAPAPVAVVAKPCDSRAINVLLGENRFIRNQVVVIGVACDGILDGAGEKAFPDNGGCRPEHLQPRCRACSQRLPLVYDHLVGGSEHVAGPPAQTQVGQVELESHFTRLEQKTPGGRMEFWLAQFDRCLRCYACRQACPMCYCPTCLYERDDSLWVGLGVRVNEKRAFHLGRAFHLAGRCVGCNECERACPVDIPISLLNRKLALEIQAAFGFQPGLNPAPSPLTTILKREES